jgi:hypothetical protein
MNVDVDFRAVIVQNTFYPQSNMWQWMVDVTFSEESREFWYGVEKKQMGVSKRHAFAVKWMENVAGHRKSEVTHPTVI